MKLPFTFGLKLVFRLLLPGFIMSIGLLPVMTPVLKTLNLELPVNYAFSISVIITGWLFVIFEMHIYMFFEGRRYWPWPKFLRDKFIESEQARLRKLNQQKDKYKDFDRLKYLEISQELRRFPMDEQGQYFVKFPTKIGNLIESYESYPLRIYGMDSIFYWHRIWLSVDQNIRNEIDGQQAIADSTLYVSFALFISGFLYLIYAIISSIGVVFYQNMPPANVLVIISILIFLSSHLLYRGSLYLHAQFGEIYKALFDMHHDNVCIDRIIEEIVRITDDDTFRDLPQKEKYRIAWRYMHNYRIRTNDSLLSPTEYSNNKKNE